MLLKLADETVGAVKLGENQLHRLSIDELGATFYWDLKRQIFERQIPEEVVNVL